MTELLTRFINRISFDSYADFRENYRLDCPETFNFAVDVVDAWAEAETDKTALVWCNDDGEEKTFTFSDISLLSRRAAAWLRAQGVRRGDRVMVLLKRRWEYWVTAVALHRIGAVLIPASYQLASKDIRYRLDAAEVRLLIAWEEDWIVSQCEAAETLGAAVPKALVGSSRAGWLSYSAALADPDAPLFDADPDIRARDIMLIYFTSGTTGMPKMVVHDFSYPLGHIVTAKYWQCVQNGGLHFTGVDSGWAKFGWGCIYGQWTAGSAILGYDCANNFRAPRMMEVIRRHRPTSLCVPGTIYRFMMREGLTREVFSSVQHCCTAGEPLSPEIVRDFEAVTGLTIHEGFGQSESSVLVANFPWFEPRPGSMGKPSPLYDIALVDAEGRECKPGEEGELVIRNLDKFWPAALLRGYIQDGELVPPYDEHFVYHTGDMVWADEDGYFWFIGRNDDIIKCSAYRIGPFEIESVLLTHPAVRECAITGAPDPMRGQVVKATIVLDAGFSPSDALTKELQNYVKRLTAPYKYPRVVEYVESLPKTTSGKIIRSRIRSAACAAAAETAAPAAPAWHIRTPRREDAQAMLDYLEAVSGESDFLLTGPGETHRSIESEEAFIARGCEGNSLLLVAVDDAENIISIASLQAGRLPRIAHQAELGVSVRRDWWNRGVGRAMLERIERHARAAEGLEVITLTVMADNARAIGLYRSLGYREIGRFPKYMKIGDSYKDALLMNLYL